MLASKWKEHTNCISWRTSKHLRSPEPTDNNIMFKLARQHQCLRLWKFQKQKKNRVCVRECVCKVKYSALSRKPPLSLWRRLQERTNTKTSSLVFFIKSTKTVDSESVGQDLLAVCYPSTRFFQRGNILSSASMFQINSDETTNKQLNKTFPI